MKSRSMDKTILKRKVLDLQVENFYKIDSFRLERLILQRNQVGDPYIHDAIYRTVPLRGLREAKSLPYWACAILQPLYHLKRSG